MSTLKIQDLNHGKPTTIVLELRFANSVFGGRVPDKSKPYLPGRLHDVYGYEFAYRFKLIEAR